MKIFRNVISPGYLPLMRIPLIEGRDFTEHDDEKSQSGNDREPDICAPVLCGQQSRSGGASVAGANGSRWSA